MKWIIRRRPSASAVAIVLALLALFVALGQTASALKGRNQVFSDDIVNGQVKSADIRNDNLRGGGLTAADLRASSVGSSELADGAIQAADLAPGTIPAAAPSPGPVGARAFGRVDDEGPLTRSKNLASVTHPDTGIYCIVPAAGINPDSAVLVVGPDSTDNEANSASADESYVEWVSGGTDCPASALEVFTYLYDGDSVDDDDGGGNTVGDELRPDESFAFLIP